MMQGSCGPTLSVDLGRLRALAPYSAAPLAWGF